MKKSSPTPKNSNLTLRTALTNVVLSGIFLRKFNISFFKISVILQPNQGFVYREFGA
jgi:uncharacterized membrane protein YobD (UPF0266 family)